MHRLLTLKPVSRLSSMFRFKFSTAKPTEIAVFTHSFLNSSNVNYLENLYSRWATDPSSVSPSFGEFFNGLGRSRAKSTITDPHNLSNVDEALRMKLLLDAYRLSGHEFADTDPLQLNAKRNGSQPRSVIDYRSFGFTEADLDKNINVSDIGSGIGVSEKTGWTLRKLIAYLEKIYCHKVGFEYMHLNNKNERIFIREKIQNLEKFTLTKQDRVKIWKRLCKDECFNQFLAKKWVNYKRYGVEGINSVVEGMSVIIEEAAKHGTEYLALGMAHRGRFNIVHCAFGSPAEKIYDVYLDHKKYKQNETGDVKYHMAFDVERETESGKKINLSLLPNPSHLQAVNPLIYGKVRAIQDYIGDKDKNKSIGILIHGDAAVTGQGVVYESLQMQDLNDYSTGGIIHIVTNNQLGFTAEQNQGRSTFYCTEIGKVVNSPIFHVNADEPDLVHKAFQIAIEYRNTFKKDIFIDLIGYRKYGHNEQDQPLFTQPLMYHKIKETPSVFVKYTETLLKEGVITEEDVKQERQINSQTNEKAYKLVAEGNFKSEPDQLPEWQKIKVSQLWGNKTGVAKNELDVLFNRVSTWPEDFNVHATIQRLYDERVKNYNAGEGLDMATMESLAFASLLREGFDVRLSGQDVERGTFSHRHAVLSDQKIDREKFTFLKTINPKTTICNSNLSEFGVMGFEYGYTITNPNTLIIWEAQFGDFANVAQIMIDNFVVSGEAKWNIQSSLVLNLPHGMDGQGPEHSSARLERFLQLSNDSADLEVTKLTTEERIRNGNIQVAYCSTSANYFHVLRRQLKRDFRKPLILMISKKLLKLKSATSKVSDIVEGTEFQTVIEQPFDGSAKDVKKVIFCSGQFYYELKNTKEQKKFDNIVIVRIEQIAPFPQIEVQNVLAKYPNAEIIWSQEEHENQGAWGYIRPRLKLITQKPVHYYGRNSLAASAGGTLKHHKMEEEMVLKKLFS